MNDVRRAVWVGLVSWAACGCGGSTTPDAKSGGDSPASATDGADLTDQGGGEVGVAAPRLPSCDDGTCFSCGDTICMTGFYCDADAPGGAACSWLPACTERGVCGCLKRELGANCSCEEKNGGPHVTCS